MDELDAGRRRDLRLRLGLHLVWIVPAGFAAKLYQGPAGGLVRDSLAAVFYELFWIFLVYGLYCSRRAVVGVPAGVLVATSALEVLQLSKAPLLQSARSFFLGRALLGTTFTWWDFPVYVASCVLGCYLLRRQFRAAHETAA